jgi:hypothetical protein
MLTPPVTWEIESDGQLAEEAAQVSAVTPQDSMALSSS